MAGVGFAVLYAGFVTTVFSVMPKGSGEHLVMLGLTARRLYFGTTAALAFRHFKCCGPAPARLSIPRLAASVSVWAPG